MKFAYWDVRGIGAAPRLLLKYVKAEFEDFAYPIAAHQDWFDQKQKLGLDFPNLPYLIDGDLKLTQSNAIIRYLGRKYDLVATADPAMAREDMLLFQLTDLHMRMLRTAYYNKYENDQAFEEEMQQLRKDAESNFEMLDRFVGANAWTTGDRLSYVDFLAYEIIERFRQLLPSGEEFLAKFANLARFMQRFEALEPIREYIASEEFKKAPFFGPYAKIGNKRRD